MKTYVFYLNVGVVGAKQEEEVDFDDGTTEEEIQECFEDWLGNFDMGFYEKD
jgi:hypothetical protein